MASQRETLRQTLSTEWSEQSAGLSNTFPDEGRVMQLRLWEALVSHAHCFQMLKFAQLTQF